MNSTIYLDHAATSPIHPEVVQVMAKSLEEDFGNASSQHAYGRKSRYVLDQARRTFAQAIGAKPSEIVINSGGTEGDNTAIIGSARALSSKGRHIVTTAIEHQAVMKTMAFLEEEGFEVTYLPVDEEGVVDLADLQAALRDDTILVSIMYGNNEVGSIQPIAEIARIVEEHSEANFHTDAVQAFGSQDINVEASPIDLLSVSSHKINGPKGIGFLYIKEGTPMEPLALGGNQENKRRAGTENIPAIKGFQEAVTIRQNNLGAYDRHVQGLKDQFLQGLKDRRIDFSVNGPLEPALPHILNIHFPGVPSDQLLIQLDLQGLAASAGSACTAGTLDPSHVLVAMYGEDSPKISESLRLSFGVQNTREEIHRALDILESSISKFKK